MSDSRERGTSERDKRTNSAMTAPMRDEPLVRVVRGEPGPDELAALVAVLAARAGATPAPGPSRTAVWRDRSRAVRPLLLHGPGRWATSKWPR